MTLFDVSVYRSAIYEIKFILGVSLTLRFDFFKVEISFERVDIGNL